MDHLATFSHSAEEIFVAEIVLWASTFLVRFKHMKIRINHYYYIAPNNWPMRTISIICYNREQALQILTHCWDFGVSIHIGLAKFLVAVMNLITKFLEYHPFQSTMARGAGFVSTWRMGPAPRHNFMPWLYNSHA